MPVQLSYGGISWKLPKRKTLKSIQDDIRKAMKDRSPLSVTLDGGETLILNGAGLGYVLLFDDKGDLGRAPSSVFDFGSVISSYGSDSASVISASPASVISSGTGSVISSWRGGPGSVS
jgi:hypothetical protein